jgi:cob(I)alamin adenosyltransferase
MSTVKLTLAVPRTGPKGAQNVGDEIRVGLKEATRLIAAGHVDEPSAAVMKKIRAAGAPENTSK